MLKKLYPHGTPIDGGAGGWAEMVHVFRQTHEDSVGLKL